MNVDAQRLTDAWNYCKIKVPLEKFLNVCENYPTIYKHDKMQALTPEEVSMFQTIFHFTAESFLGWKNQLIRFVSQHKEFYHDDPAIMFQKMEDKVLEFRQQYPDNPDAASIKYVNWLPLYGGIILNRKAAIAEKRDVFANITLPI